MPRTCRSWRSKPALPGGVPGLRWSVISLVVSKNPPQRLQPLEMVSVDRSTEALREPKAKAPSNFLRLEAVPFSKKICETQFRWLMAFLANGYGARAAGLRGHPGRRPAAAAAKTGCGKNTKAIFHRWQWERPHRKWSRTKSWKNLVR